MKKLLSSLMVFVLVLAGCSTTPPQEPVIGLVTDTGGISDKSFNQSAYEGMIKYAEEKGIATTYQATTNDAEIETNLANMASRDTIEVLVLPGFKFANAVYNIAPQFSEKKFILLDARPTDSEGVVHELDNVYSIEFKEEESGFMAGFIASQVTKANKVGFVGGEPVPAVVKFEAGFKEGLKVGNPDVEFSSVYANSFVDASIGLGLTDTLIKNDHDVIFTAAGGVNGGVIQAVKNSPEQDWVIGVDRDMKDEGEDVILTSAMKNLDVAVYNTLTQIYVGESIPKVQVLGYKDGGVGLPEDNPHVDQKTIARAKTALTQYLIEKPIPNGME